MLWLLDGTAIVLTESMNVADKHIDTWTDRQKLHYSIGRAYA